MWWLRFGNERSDAFSQSDDDENDGDVNTSGSGIFLIINGERARSKRTKEEYGAVVDIRQKSDTQVEFVFEDNRATLGSMDDMDSQASVVALHATNVKDLVTRFHQSQASQDSQQTQASQDSQQTQASQDSQQTQDSQPTQQSQLSALGLVPLCHSTPMPQTQTGKVVTPLRLRADKRKQKESSQQSQKKRSKENNPLLTSKCHGVHTVGLHQLLKAPEGLLSKGSSEHQTQDIKTVLKELGLSQLPVLPVITTREWQGTVHEEDRFIIVGGQNLFNAVCDLAADIKFKQYRKVLVRIYGDLSGEEMREVELVQDLQALLMGSGQETLKARVARFRKVLYERAGVAQEEEPPKSNPEWRRICAASVGKATESKAMKCLEPTFQLALYSRRCYGKLMRYFEIQEQQGHDVKQAFHLLQGLEEDVKYRYLCEIVSGTLTTRQMSKQASDEKKFRQVKKELMKALNTASWEETVENFPHHTTPDVLAPYRGLDFKKSVPRSFLELVKSAEHQQREPAMINGTDIVHNLSEAPPNCTLAVLNVSKEHQYDEDQLGSALGPRSSVAYICADLVGAAEIVTSLREKKIQHTYSVVVDKEGNGVRHMICTRRRSDSIEEAPPEFARVIGSPAEAVRTVVEGCSEPDDRILIAGPNADAALVALREKRKVVYLSEGNLREEERVEDLQSVLQQSSQEDMYEFDDDEY